MIRLACSPVLPALALGTLVLGLPVDAMAQRGGDYLRQERPDEPPSSGFPGFFDAYTAPAGSVIGELPLLGVDYGVTDNLTVGTALVFFAPALAGAPGGYAKVRYRPYSEERFALALTLYGGAFSLSGADELLGEDAPDSGLLGLGVLTSNASYYPTGHSAATLTLISATTLTRQSDMVNGTEVRASSLVTEAGAALSYEHFFLKWFGIQLTVVSVPLVLGSTDTDVASADVSGSLGLRGSTLLRALCEFRPGKWLMSVGAMAMLEATMPATVFEFSRRW